MRCHTVVTTIRNGHCDINPFFLGSRQLSVCHDDFHALPQVFKGVDVVCKDLPEVVDLMRSFELKGFDHVVVDGLHA